MYFYKDMNSQIESFEMNQELLAKTTFSYLIEVKTDKDNRMIIDGETEDNEHEDMEVDGQAMNINITSKDWLKSNDIIREPIRIELVRFLTMLDELISEFHPRLLVPQAWFEQCLLCLREDASRLLVFTPTNLFETMLHISLDVFTYERVLACLPLDFEVNANDKNSHRIRKLAAKMLCVFDQLKKVTVSSNLD